MTATSIESHPEAFVQRLLRAANEGEERDDIDRHPLTAAEAREVVLLLVNEALRLLGVDPRLGERLCHAGIEIAARAGDAYAGAMARMRLGDVLAQQGRNAEAQEAFDHAQAEFLRLQRPLEAARTRIGWIRAEVGLGRPDAALAAARGARKTLLAFGETGRVAALDMHTGNIHGEYGRNREAVRPLLSALTLYSSLGETGRRGAANSGLSLGTVLKELGRYRDAIGYLRRAADTFRQLGDTGGLASATRTLGETQMSLGHYGVALRTFEESRPAFAAIGLSSGAVWLARDEADCYLQLNRPADALATLDAAQLALDATQRVPDAVAIGCRRIAAHLALDDHEAALAALSELERRFPVIPVQHRAWLALQRARAALVDGSPLEALASAHAAEQSAIAAGIRRFAGEAALLRGSVLLTLNDLTGAVREAARGRRIAASLDSATLLYRAQELLGRIEESNGNPRRAIRRYRAAISQLEREQHEVIFEFRDTFATTRGYAYERLAALLLNAGRVSEALLIIERAKSRALGEVMSGALQLRPRGGAVARWLTRELTLARAEYSAAVHQAGYGGGRPEGEADREQVQRVRELETRVTRLQRQLQLETQRDGFVPVEDTPIAATPFRPPARTALIEFFATGDDLIRCTMNGRTVRGTVMAGGVKKAIPLIRALRLNLGAMEQAESWQREPLAAQARGVLQRLHELLLGGLHLPDSVRGLIVVPHGPLHYVPFHALHDGERFLIERLSIRYAPSATVFAACRARSQDGGHRSALVLADSAGGQLPFVAQEAKVVAAALGCRAHTDGEATRALIVARGRSASVIHIAAHGSFRADAPLFSSVVLADGPLTTADVFNLDLRGAFVVLSACETGRAVLGGGDELVGLARAFLCAGASGLLISQWRVDDEATSALMQRFYRECSTGKGVSSAIALQRAQVAMLRGDAGTVDAMHPFYWAGFQAIGDVPLTVGRRGSR